jgi:predicted phage-related endonuclease
MPRLSPSEVASRREGLGSTDLVEIAGLAPWSGAGPMRVYCEKMGIATDDEDDEERGETLNWGHELEPVIAEWYARHTGSTLILGGRVDGPPRMWATLDRKVVAESRIVEVKNVGSPALYRHWDASSPDGVPDYVRAQVTVAMGFMRVGECDVVASVGGRPPHVWRIFYDDELLCMLVAKGNDFLRLLDSHTPPPMDHTDACKTYLRATYPSNVDREIIEADDRLDEIGVARAIYAHGEKSNARARAQCDAELLAACRDHGGIAGSSWKMTWRVGQDGVRRSRFTARETD